MVKRRNYIILSLVFVGLLGSFYTYFQYAQKVQEMAKAPECGPSRSLASTNSPQNREEHAANDNLRSTFSSFIVAMNSPMEQRAGTCATVAASDNSGSAARVPASASLYAKQIPYETAGSCGTKRMELETKLAGLSGDFRLQRKEFNPKPDDIAPFCIFTAMKQFPDFKNFYASCGDCKSGRCSPVRGSSKPCLTQNYVSAVYNSFADVTDCLGLSQKQILPKLSNESGFHINTYGGAGDTGIGQLTAIAIKDSNMFWENYVSEVKNSKAPACKRIMPLVSKMSKTRSDGRDSCSLMLPPENPLKNIFYTGIVSRRNQQMVDSYFDRAKIDVALKTAGLAEKHFSKIKGMLYLLGYNAGAVSGAILLKNYVEAKLRAHGNRYGRKITEHDFDFSQSLGHLQNKKCSDIGGSLRIDSLTFPEYARLCQGAGTNGYLSILYQAKANIDREIGDSSCTSSKYLQL